MKLLMFALMLLSFSASAQDRFNRAITRCYTDLGNKCVITLVDEETNVPTGIVVNREEFSVNSEIIQNLYASQVEFEAKEPAAFRTLLAQSAEVKYVELEPEIIGWTQIQDEEWQMYFDAAVCGGSAGICAWGLWSTLLTGGGALLAAEASCGIAVYACITAQRSWQKWQNVQIRKRNELRLKGVNVPIPGRPNTGSSSEAGGGTGSGNLGDGGTSSGSGGLGLGTSDANTDDSVPCPRCTIKGEGGEVQPV
jgi:hypothetical protein